MESTQDYAPDGAVTFLPHRLNRQPIVVRGLTADELWICTGLAATAGLGFGIPLAWVTGSIAMIPTAIVISIAAGLFIGGGLLRRQKRGRPETWLYRHLQWWVACRYLSLANILRTQELVTRSGYWTTRRGGA